MRELQELGFIPDSHKSIRGYEILAAEDEIAGSVWC
jgi:hypothetical protein